MQARAIEAGRKEVQRFIDSLRDLNDTDMGVVLAVTTVIRVNMQKETLLPKDIYTAKTLPPAGQLGRFQLDLNKLAGQFNKRGQPTDALGTLVISYSLRCLNVPEFRHLGSEMWTELKRGYASVETALVDGEETKGEKFPKGVWKAWQEIPVGLEPSGSDS